MLLLKAVGWVGVREATGTTPASPVKLIKRHIMGYVLLRGISTGKGFAYSIRLTGIYTPRTCYKMVD